MPDKAFGWTVEMQVRAVRHGLRIGEFDVPYRRRSAGVSKISRTVIGTVKAGRTIRWVIARELVCEYSIGVKASPAGGRLKEIDDG